MQVLQPLQITLAKAPICTNTDSSNFSFMYTMKVPLGPLASSQVHVLPCPGASLCDAAQTHSSPGN